MNNLSYSSNELLEDGTPVHVEHMFQDFDPNQLEELKILRENEKHIYSPEFIPFYISIVKEYELTSAEGLIYGFIRFYCANGTGRFYFTNLQMAEILNISEATVERGISVLRKKELIHTGYRIKGGGGTIRFINGVLLPISSVPTDKNVGVRLPQNVGVTLPQNVGANNNKINNNKINNIYMSENQKNKKEVKDESNLGFIKEFGSKRKLEDLSPFLEKFNEITGKHFRKLDKKTTAQINELIKEKYSLEDWSAVIKIAIKDKYITGDNPGGVYYLTPEFISRSNKFEKYMNSKKEFKKQVKPIDDYALKTNKSFVDDLKKKYLEDRDSLSDGQKEFVEKYMDKNKF